MVEMMILLEHQPHLNLSQTGIAKHENRSTFVTLFNQPQIRRLGGEQCRTIRQIGRLDSPSCGKNSGWKIVHKCPRGGRSRLAIVVLDETALPHVIIHYSFPWRFPEIYFRRSSSPLFLRLFYRRVFESKRSKSFSFCSSSERCL